jgi:hypothetical protein
MKPLIESGEPRRVLSLQINFDRTLEGSNEHG